MTRALVVVYVLEGVAGPTGDHKVLKNNLDQT